MPNTTFSRIPVPPGGWHARLALLLALLALPLPARAQEAGRQTENVFLITLDGLRWQELFAGADSALIRDERYVDDVDRLVERFWRDDAHARREALMPFFWSVIAEEGQLYGNRHAGCTVDLTNGHWFSYPGYNEILTGASDDERIDSNARRPNPNVTVLEYVNRQEGFEGRVAAFGSWDVFPYIVNEERSGVPVNAGFEPASGDDLTAREVFLNELLTQIPSPWGSVRLDAFTYHYALEHVKKHRPRLVYIAFGETDDFAHDADYQAYLEAANRTDDFIRRLWDFVQSDDSYRGKTAFVITTDHGRGTGDDWTSHGTRIEGSHATWIAMLGSDIPARGEVRSTCRHYTNQVAATVARLLGLDYREGSPGEPLFVSRAE